ncbi:hypothetical protein GCM10009557_04250 [Virgisporangium ochraceum]
MKPRLILAMIAGGAAGVSTFMVTGSGLVAAPAPGSIFAYLAVTPKGGLFGVLLGIVIATAVTFVAASALLGFGRNEPAEEDEVEAEAELEAARARTAENKAASKNQAPAAVNREATPREA